MKNQVKRALFSVDNLRNIEELAGALKKMGWHIIATKETVAQLKQNNIEVEDVVDFTGVSTDYGFPPTLHSKIEAALTLDVSFKIDLVYDIPYPHDKGNDVGGHALLALGVKGERIVAMTPEDMQQVIEELEKDAHHLRISADYHRQLLDKANACIAEHYLVLARRQGEGSYDGWKGKAHSKLLNGENPYQVPADLFISENHQDDLSLGKFNLCNDSSPCFTNVADMDCIIQTMCLAAEAFQLNLKKIPYIAIVAKHGNPCGMAVDWESPKKAIEKALFGNPNAIWGGECITNFKIDEALGQLLYQSDERGKTYGSSYWMLDVIVAPDFDDGAFKILSKKSSRKLFRNQALHVPKLSDFPWHYRNVRGGFLRQPPNDYILDISKADCNDSQKNKQDIDSLIIAWSVVYSSYHGGNEVALVKDKQLLGVGGGSSTVDAAKTAVSRTQFNKHDTKDSVFAADAFFPFTDAPEILINAGCCIGIFPSGGKNEAVVKKYFTDNNINAIYIPSQYRGFCRH